MAYVVDALAVVGACTLVVLAVSLYNHVFRTPPRDWDAREEARRC